MSISNSVNNDQSRTGITNRAFTNTDDNRNNNNNNLTWPVYNENSLEERFVFKKLKSDNAFKSAGNYIRKYYKPSGNCMKDYFLARFPFFNWIRSYDYKQDFIKDFVAGLTIGVVHIPQGMAYALMAGVPAINGLYVSFFTIVLYVLLGTSKHLSVGTYAIVSLMVISSIKKYDGILYSSNTKLDVGNNSSHTIVHRSSDSHSGSAPAKIEFLSDDPTDAKVQIAMALSLLSGIIQVIFGILHIGFVTKYLSDSIVNGFTCAAAFHVVVSQISTLLGIKLGDNHLAFVLIGDFIEIFKNISKTNIATLIISIVSMIFLYIVKMHINERFKQKLPVPIPVELIVVIIGTVVSYFAKFNEKYNVKIIGNLPLGIPKPTVPPVRIFGMVIGDSIAIAIVSFALNVSMAKLFAKKHKYEIKANQELFAYGVGNIVIAFFRGFPACVGLSRCVILDGVGGKTQVYGIFSSILVLIVVLFLGPLFRTLPNACLAAIIVIALKAMVLEFRIFPKLYKKSKMEALGWLVTYLGVMILDVDVGLYIGVGFSLVLVIFRSQRARTSVLGNIPGTYIFEAIDACEEAREFVDIKIIRYEESVYYANVDNFKYKIMKLVGINPAEVMNKVKKEKSIIEKSLKAVSNEGFIKKLKNRFSKKSKVGVQETPDVNLANDLESQINNSEKIKSLLKFKIKHLVIDCSCVNFIDSQGVNAILQLYEGYKEIDIKMYLTYCKQNVVKTFKKESMQDKFSFDFIFPTTNDAVYYIIKSAAANVAQDSISFGDNNQSHRYSLSNFDGNELYPPSAYKDQDDLDDDELDIFKTRL